jgi:hypothetical protein
MFEKSDIQNRIVYNVLKDPVCVGDMLVLRRKEMNVGFQAGMYRRVFPGESSFGKQGKGIFVREIVKLCFQAGSKNQKTRDKKSGNRTLKF